MILQYHTSISSYLSTGSMTSVMNHMRHDSTSVRVNSGSLASKFDSAFEHQDMAK